MAETSSAAVLSNILTSPSAAFAAIRERPSPWLPLILLIAGSCAVSLLYFNEVDMGWFFEQQMERAAERGNLQLTDAQRAQAIEAQASMSPALLGGIAAVTTALGLLIVFSISALYLLGVSLKAGIKYKQWFAFVTWSAVPMLLGIVAQIANLLATDARFLPQQGLNPLSFGNLLGIDFEQQAGMGTLLLYLDPTTMWVLVLQIIGYQLWTKRSTVVSALILLAPLAVIFVLVGLAAS